MHFLKNKIRKEENDMFSKIKSFFSNFSLKKAGIVGAIVAGVVGIGFGVYKIFF